MNAICGLVLPHRGDPVTAPLERMAAASALRSGTGAARLYEFAGGGFASHQAFAPPADADGARNAVHEPGLTLVCAAELYNAAAYYLGVDKTYYTPTDRGYEQRIRQYLEWIGRAGEIEKREE